MTATELTVVVPSVNGLADLRGCLGALANERTRSSLEVLVIERCGDAVRKAVRREFPWATMIEVDRNTPIPAMRALAFGAATGEFVAVIEDHIIAPPGWANQLLSAAREGEQVVAGAVENAATERLVDWAAFLCEYSQCINPLPRGRAAWLTGNNVIYPRTLLARYADVIGRGGWENELHEKLKRDGIRLECRPEIEVGHRKHYSVGEYVAQRYWYARSYAGTRIAGASSARKLAYGAAAFALPPILFGRIVGRVVGKRRYVGQLVRSLPLLALFVTSWALGEVVGYLAGPGDSLAKVR